MRRLAYLPALAFVALALVGWAPGGAKNLEYFPKDIDLEKLKGEMKTISRSLGVECDKCHVVKPTRDMSLDTEGKKSGRSMLSMLKKMNENVLTADFLGRKRGIEGTCYMCHKGKWKVETKPENADDEKRFNAMVDSGKKKKTVDAMKKLVETLNKDYFTWKDAPKATCWMCHRGRGEFRTRLPREGAEGGERKGEDDDDDDHGKGEGEHRKRGGDDDDHEHGGKGDAPRSDGPKSDGPKSDAPKSEGGKKDPD